MWEEVLVSKCGGWRDLKNQRKCSSDSLWWRDLKEVWAIKGWKGNFEDNCSWEVGDSREIRFWEDKWMENVKLKEKFPRLFSICSDKESLLWQVGEMQENLGCGWKIDWRRRLFEWERGQEQELLRQLEEKGVNTEKEDIWVWKDDETKEYTVKSAYRILKEETQRDTGDTYVGLWKLKAQPSALLTAWRVLEDKILAKANLVRRGISVASSFCGLCGEEEETTSHLFCTCKVVWLVWSKCSEWLGVASTEHCDPKMHFSNFKISGMSKRVNQILGCVWVAVVADLWKHRNKSIFNSDRVNHIEIFIMVQVKVWSWVSFKVRRVSFSYSDWCLESLVCMISIRKFR